MIELNKEELDLLMVIHSAIDWCLEPLEEQAGESLSPPTIRQRRKSQYREQKLAAHALLDRLVNQ